MVSWYSRTTQRGSLYTDMCAVNIGLVTVTGQREAGGGHSHEDGHVHGIHSVGQR